MPIYLQARDGFPSRRAVLAFLSQSSHSGQQAWQLQLDRCSISPTGISCRDVVMQSWCLLGFSGSSVPSCSFEHGKELAVDHDQNIYGWKTRNRFASDFSMIRTKMDSVVLVIGFCFVLCSFTVFPRLVLCHFSLCTKRAVGFLQLSANIYIKPLDA